jgi:hypothetical protein
MTKNMPEGYLPSIFAQLGGSTQSSRKMQDAWADLAPAKTEKPKRPVIDSVKIRVGGVR